MDTQKLEEMTWPEIRDALQNGMRTVVVCAASIEQHGPHLAERTDTTLGYAEAEALARRLGDALVAPVIRPGLSAHHNSSRPDNRAYSNKRAEYPQNRQSRQKPCFHPGAD